jgi:hypothetical protein
VLIKDIIETDTVNYKEISMFIIFSTCNFKCDRECGMQVCQNSTLASLPNINIDIEHLIYKYLSNPITNAIVCGGLEPFDSWEDLYTLITHFRLITDDDIVIYTGYNPNEIEEQINALKHYKNIIVKFGRFIPNQSHHYDKILGVELSSPNQYAERIS